MPASGSTPLPRPLRLFWLINVSLGVLAAIVAGFNRYVLHWGEPYNSPFLPFRHYCDFWAFVDRFDHYHRLDFYSTTGGSIFSYPAPLTLPYAFFFFPQHHQHVLFTLETTLPVLVLLGFLARAMVNRGVRTISAILFVTSAFLFSYPFWFEYFLGNIEIVVFLITTAGLIAWFRGHSYLAAILIGVAGSMKLFPFIFLALFLSRRQYWQFACGILAAVVLYPTAVWMACPSFAVALPGIKMSSTAIDHGVILRWDWVLINYDHSLWGVWKQMTHLLGFGNVRPSYEVRIYTLLAAVSGLALYLARIRRLPIFNQLLTLSLASILLPPMSNDYTLLYLYLPWALLVLATLQQARMGMTRPGTMAAFVCFGLAFSPETEFIIRHATLGGQYKVLILLVLFWVGLKYPLPLPSEDIEPTRSPEQIADAVPAT